MVTFKAPFFLMCSTVASILLGALAHAEEFQTPTAARARNRATPLSRVCPKRIKSVPFGFLWKPASDVPGPRGGRPVVLLTRRNKTRTSSLLVISAAGKLLCSFGMRIGQPGINGGADHYYSGWGSGCCKTGSQLV
jgi:hypothetical protein